jgi:hypothetical protein
MNRDEEHEIIGHVISLLDIFVVLLLEEDPIPSIVLTTLLKIVTKDPLLRISLILLVIILGITQHTEGV